MVGPRPDARCQPNDLSHTRHLCWSSILKLIAWSGEAQFHIPTHAKKTKSRLISWTCLVLIIYMISTLMRQKQVQLFSKQSKIFNESLKISNFTNRTRHFGLNLGRQHMNMAVTKLYQIAHIYKIYTATIHRQTTHCLPYHNHNQITKLQAFSQTCNK